ncbi:hypothetical protein ANCCAN_20112, partial [Ancylostoma caninum]
MSSVPSLAALDHTHLKWDKEWMFHKLPKDNIEIPRHHLPDPEAEAIPGTSKQESLADLERNWLDSVAAVAVVFFPFVMGNEQSASGSSPQGPSNSTFSFLSGRGLQSTLHSLRSSSTLSIIIRLKNFEMSLPPRIGLVPGPSLKKSKGIVVVSGGNSKVESLEDDEIYKRFQEIPRFLPIYRHAIGKKDLSPNEYQQRMSSRPLFRMANRFQQHLRICAKAVSTDQSQIISAVKAVEASTAAITTALIERKKASDIFVAELQGLDKLRDDVLHIQLMLEELVPMVETLNELLVPSDRLPPLSLSRILERTPVSTSASSSQESTPKHVPAGNSSLARPSTRDERSHIPPIEEVRVVDRALTSFVNLQYVSYTASQLWTAILISNSGFLIWFDLGFCTDFVCNMTEPDLSFIKSDIDLSEVAPLNRRRVVAFVNCYILKMTDFLNDFANRTERLILESERQLHAVDIKLQLLEAKLAGIPDPGAKQQDSVISSSAGNAKVSTASQLNVSASDAQSRPDAPSSSQQSVAAVPETAATSVQPPAPANAEVAAVEQENVLLVKDDPAFAKYFKMLKLDFKDLEEIGRGGFGVVYAATQPNGERVALKKFFEDFVDGNDTYVVMELCELGSMRSYVKKNGPLSDRAAAYVLRQIISAVKYMHREGILHRDLSSGNVLISRIFSPEKISVKLCDFGLATHLRKGETAC